VVRAHPQGWRIDLERWRDVSASTFAGAAAATRTSRILGSEGVSVPAGRPIKPAYVRDVRAFGRPCEASMIPDVAYRFTIRPLPAYDAAAANLIAFPDLPGCVSDGATIEQAIANGIDAMRGWLKAMLARASDPRTDLLRGGLSRRPTAPWAGI
jgi:HicB_like antitoxin of bacterial toxin-antitoxin system